MRGGVERESLARIDYPQHCGDVFLLRLITVAGETDVFTDDVVALGVVKKYAPTAALNGVKLIEGGCPDVSRRRRAGYHIGVSAAAVPLSEVFVGGYQRGEDGTFVRQGEAPMLRRRYSGSTLTPLIYAVRSSPPWYSMG